MRWRERLSVFNLLEFEFALLLNDDQHFFEVRLLYDGIERPPRWRSGDPGELPSYF